MSFWIPFFRFLIKNGSRKGAFFIRPGDFSRSFSRPFPKLDFLMHFGRSLAPFWLHFGSFLLPFGSFLAPFGSLLAPFWSLLLNFYSLLASFLLSSYVFYNLFKFVRFSFTATDSARHPQTIRMDS